MPERTNADAPKKASSNHLSDLNFHTLKWLVFQLVQRVNKGFNARRFCHRRTYEYYIPAFVLGLEGPFPTSPSGTAATDGSGAVMTEADKRKLLGFREALQMYVGTRPFHNFAGNRRQYVKQQQQGTFDMLGMPGMPSTWRPFRT